MNTVKDPEKDPEKDTVKDTDNYNLSRRWGEKWVEISAWWQKETLQHLSTNEIKILDIMASQPQISMLKMAKTIGIVETTVGNNIDKLKTRKIIERKGPAKGGYWVIIHPGK